MRAQATLLRQLKTELSEIHEARLNLFFTAVLTLLRSGKLSLTCLGRAIATRTKHKHGIKRIDRLLGNRHLHKETLHFYRVLARRVLGTATRAVVLVDWTAVTPDLWALTAAVSFDGRALTIYAETHPISRYIKPHVHAKFLRTLRRVLPPSCSPIIVADAGFRTPFMKVIASMGWDYVIRVRKSALLCAAGEQRWVALKNIFRRARTVATDLGLYIIGLRTRHVCRLVTIRKEKRHHTRRHCRARPGSDVAKHRRAFKEPWVLATSLSLESAAQVVSIYAKRMQIEETYRDTKNPRFGFSLSHARTRSDKRADMLMLLAAFTHLLAVLVGLAAEHAGWHLDYQANTERHRRVLSLAMLGRLVATDRLSQILSDANSRTAWAVLRAICAAALPT
jgi:predicted small integral membrane protein